jgi:hypothetical protein
MLIITSETEMTRIVLKIRVEVISGESLNKKPRSDRDSCGGDSNNQNHIEYVPKKDPLGRTFER